MKKAFTLIELLVVIAIIAILAAILFPVFAQAKAAAKKTQDLSNMKQMGTASNMYFTDYDDALFLYRTKVANLYASDPNVGSGTCSNGSGGRRFWNQLLQPYVKSQDLFKGPDVPSPWVDVNPQGAAIHTNAAFTSPTDISDNVGGCSYGGQNSYGVNRILFNANQEAYNYSAISETANTLEIVDARYYDVMPKFTDRNASNAWAPLGQLIGDPGATKYYVDTNNNCDYYNYWVQLGLGQCNNTDGNPYGSVTKETTYFNNVAKRNGGILNVTFVDGHAKGFKAERVVYDLVDFGNKNQSMWDPWKQGVK